MTEMKSRNCAKQIIEETGSTGMSVPPHLGTHADGKYFQSVFPAIEKSDHPDYGLRALLALVLLLCTVVGPGFAQETSEQSAPELAKKAQNPVASMISVPFQNNFNFGVGSKDDLQNVLNIQPVIPFRVSQNWNLITRTIVPLVHQPDLAPGFEGASGLGDIQLSLFLSPAKPGKVIWGIGPIFGLPTATDDVLGSKKFSIGPTAVALTNRGPWVLGALVNNLFSVAGDSDRRDINQMLLQPFVNYNMHGGWYLVSSPINTADWKSDADNRWTVPLGGGVGKILRVGTQPMNISLQAFHNVVHPDGAANWSLRFQTQLLFPKK